MKKFSCTLLSIIVFGLGIFLNTNWGSIPAMGSLLNPFRGFWRSAAREGQEVSRYISLDGLKEPAEVVWDQEGIPHIRARNNEDLYFVQGYVTAKERLFQMDFQARAMEAVLSEVLGDRTLSMDQKLIQFGMRELIHKVTEEFRKDAQTWRYLEAYSRGVNRYLDSISRADWPVEYKILGASPLPWSPQRTASLFALMNFRLAGGSQDLMLTEYEQRFGQERVEALFPYEQFGARPYAPGLKLKGTQLPQPPDKPFVSSFKGFPELLKPAPWNGSNNWAVSGKKTASQHSLLANDTHLAYALPNIWFEVQLTTPEMNVYGASLPGAPAVIIGFNNHIAWGVTNATPDILDYYEVKLKERGKGWEYFYDGSWRPVEVRNEPIVTRKNSLYSEHDTQTVYWTHHGPILYIEKPQNGNEAKGLAVKWGQMAGSNPFLVFLLLNRAQTRDQCEEALRLYISPSQNFVCGDADTVSVTQAGRMPKKWWGQGKYVLDGSLPEHDWMGHLDWSEIPRSNADLVFSANHTPVDSSYPYYLNWDYAEPYRAGRIQDLLSNTDKHDFSTFRAIQNDTFNPLASHTLSKLLKELSKESLTKTQQEFVKAMEHWDFQETPSQSFSLFFSNWWRGLEDLVWEAELGPRDKNLYPKASKLEQLLGDKDSKTTFDDLRTKDKIETPREMIQRSFQNAWAHLTDEGGGDWKEWTVEKVQPVEIPHLSRIPGFGTRSPISMGGSFRTVNANTSKHGPVWRMIVELGPEVKGWVNFPGGNSGNPFSTDYDNFVPSWSRGELRKAQYLSPREFDEAIHALDQGDKHLSFRNVWRMVGS